MPVTVSVNTAVTLHLRRNRNFRFLHPFGWRDLNESRKSNVTYVAEV